MKINIDTKEGSINLEDITPEEYLIIGEKNEEPVIMTKDWDSSKFEFKVLSDNFTIGNTHPAFKGDFKEEIKYHIKNGAILRAFKNEDWKEALQWLINNV